MSNLVAFETATFVLPLVGRCLWICRKFYQHTKGIQYLVWVANPASFVEICHKEGIAGAIRRTLCWNPCLFPEIKIYARCWVWFLPFDFLIWGSSASRQFCNAEVTICHFGLWFWNPVKVSTDWLCSSYRHGTFIKGDFWETSRSIVEHEIVGCELTLNCICIWAFFVAWSFFCVQVVHTNEPSFYGLLTRHQSQPDLNLFKTVYHRGFNELCWSVFRCGIRLRQIS